MADDPRGTLAPDEHHPSARTALIYIGNYLAEHPATPEAICSCAIEGNRTAEVCAETLRRLNNNEPVSDRYLMGLACFLYSLDKM